jgi:hypothetical protein
MVDPYRRCNRISFIYADVTEQIFGLPWISVINSKTAFLAHQSPAIPAYFLAPLKSQAVSIVQSRLMLTVSRDQSKALCDALEFVGLRYERQALRMFSKNVSRREKKRNVGKILSHPFRESESVNFTRHADVTKNNINSPAVSNDYLYRAVARRRFQHREAICLQKVANCQSHEHIILDEENDWSWR